jgi:hypothetical protein
MRQGEDIRSITNDKGNKFFVIYSKDGVEHLIGQHLDALQAVQTGHYFTSKPIVEKQVKKRK